MQTIRAVPVLTCALAVLGLGAGLPACAEDITLTFGWGRVLEADVDAARRIRKGDRTIQIRVTYRMQALRDPDGYRLRAANLVVRNDGRVVKSGARSGVLVQFLGLIPDWRISTAGGFVGLADFTCQHDKARRYFTDTTPSSSAPSRRDEARRWIEQMTSREVLSQQARQHWDAIVGAWAGKQIPFGRALRYETSEPIALPALSDTSIRTRHEVVALERAPCHARMVDAACVRLRRVSRPDAGDLQRAYQRMRQAYPEMAKTAGGSGPIEAVTTVELLADPGTLRPYRMSAVTRRAQESSASGAGAAQSDELTIVYRYKDRLSDFRPLPSECSP